MHLEQYKSYNELAHDGIVYDAPFMGFARSAYARYEQWTDPLVSPIFAHAAHFPPTIILAGTDDPLVDQTIHFRDRAKRDNHNHIEVALYPGMPHCFYSLPSLFSEEVECYKQIKAFVANTCN
jgi:acetyl esterase